MHEKGQRSKRHAATLRHLSEAASEQRREIDDGSGFAKPTGLMKPNHRSKLLQSFS